MKDNAFLNFFMTEDCKPATKVGFQSLNSDVAALQKGLANAANLAQQGVYKDGETIQIWARFSETDAAEDTIVTSVTMADGTVRELPTEDEAEAAPEADAEAEVDEDNIPF